jgi:type IV secretory pathway TraG/TraD family ATPase VirD4
MKCKRKLKLILDESSSLGQLNAIDDAIDKYRGYGIGTFFGFQSMGQLKKNFPTDEGQTLLSNATSIIMAVNDLATAEHFSKRLGTFTQIVQSGGRSRGGSRQHTSGGPNSSQSYSSSWNGNDNWQQQARELMKPDEVLRLDPRVLIAFPPGMPPVAVRTIRHFEEKPSFWKRRGRVGEFLQALWVLMVAALHLTVWALFAVGATLMALEEKQRQDAIEHFQQGIQRQYVPAPMHRPTFRYR